MFRSLLIFVVMIFASIGGGVSAAEAATTEPAAVGRAVVVSVRGEIDDYSRMMLESRFKEAKSLGADTVVLDLNTYGGMATAGLDMSRFIKAQRDVKTIAYVDDKAISAGAMIAMACNRIVMSPSSVLGDCAPISISSEGGLQPLPPAERAKFESPILADFYDSATRNGHPTLVAEAMVAVDRSVHYVEKGGQKKFVDDAEFAKLKDQGWKPVEGVPDPIDRSDTLLTVHADLAKKIGLATTANDVNQLASENGLTLLATLQPSVGDQAVGWLGSAIVRGILMIVFLQAIYIAFHAPGHGVAEAFAVVSLGILLGVPLLTGYATWWEILLILGGLALIAFEIFVFPGHFVSAAAGILLMLFGFVMTFVPMEPSGLPTILPATWAALHIGIYCVVGAVLVSMVMWVVLSKYLGEIPYLNRLVLTTVTGPKNIVMSPAPYVPAIGETGRAVTPLRPGGSAEFNSIIVPVLCEGFAESGTAVMVRDVSNNRILVRAVNEANVEAVNV